MKIPKKEQFEALLEAKERELAEKYGFDSPSDIPWLVTTKEVTEYIDLNGFPEGWVYHSAHSDDGIYLIKNGIFWNVYYLERGVKNYSSNFFFKKKAIHYLLDNYFFRRLGIKKGDEQFESQK